MQSGRSPMTVRERRRSLRRMRAQSRRRSWIALRNITESSRADFATQFLDRRDVVLHLFLLRWRPRRVALQRRRARDGEHCSEAPVRAATSEKERVRLPGMPVVQRQSRKARASGFHMKRAEIYSPIIRIGTRSRTCRDLRLTQYLLPAYVGGAQLKRAISWLGAIKNESVWL